MKRRTKRWLLLAAAIAVVAGATTSASWANHWNTVAFSDAVIRVEVNSTDEDAGFQVFLDGEGWEKVWVFGPHWEPVLIASTRGGARAIGGGTELFIETEEPEYEDLEELQELLDNLEPGTYSFLGRTTDGSYLVGSAELTHVVPAGPEITTPVPDDPEEEDACAEDVEIDDAVIAWDPVTTTITGSNDIDVVGYRVIVVNEDAQREFMAELPALGADNQVTVPPEFLEPDTEYGFEILAIELSGNQTITESCFVTEE